MEGELKLVSKKTARFRVVLFSDAIFWLQLRDKAGKDGRKQEFTGLAPINAMTRLVDLADNEGTPMRAVCVRVDYALTQHRAEAKNVFSVQHADGNVSFMCASAPEKRRWVREVRAHVNEQLKKDMKQKALGESGGSRTHTPLRLATSLRSSTAEIGRRDSAADSMRANTARDAERKNSFRADVPAAVVADDKPDRRGSGGSASMKAPQGLLRRERGTD